MYMELIKKQVHYTQEGKRTFDQFYLDEDYNVPDAKEDVQQIICLLYTSRRVCC